MLNVGEDRNQSFLVGNNALMLSEILTRQGRKDRADFMLRPQQTPSQTTSSTPDAYLSILHWLTDCARCLYSCSCSYAQSKAPLDSKVLFLIPVSVYLLIYTRTLY
jgi:hypothetical protein